MGEVSDKFFDVCNCVSQVEKKQYIYTHTHTFQRFGEMIYNDMTLSFITFYMNFKRHFVIIFL